MLRKGEGVVHPEHGPGVLIETQKVAFGGTTQHYYAIQLVSGERLMVPVSQAEALGLRPVVMNPIVITTVLSDVCQELPDDRDTRREVLSEKVASGDPVQIAEALRDLAWREQYVRLSRAEMGLKEKALQLLAFELAFQINVSVQTAIRRLTAILDACHLKKTA